MKTGECWECSKLGEIHLHHVVPRSRGGTKTVPLCLECHAKAHHRNKNMSTSKLVSETIKRKKLEGTWKPPSPETTTKARIASAKVRADNADAFGRKLIATIKEIDPDESRSQKEIVDILNTIGFTTPRGKAWSQPSLCRTLQRLVQRGVAHNMKFQYEKK